MEGVLNMKQEVLDKLEQGGEIEVVSNMSVSTRCMVEALGYLLNEDTGMVVEISGDNEIEKFAVYKTCDTIRVCALNENAGLRTGELFYFFDGTVH